MAKKKAYLSGATAPTSTTSSTAVATFVAPSAPATPADVATFVAQGNIAITAAVEVMKSCPVNSGLYFQALNFAQQVAGMVLDEGVKIADAVRAVGNTVGSGPEVEKAREEKDKLMTGYGFQKNKTWRNICELDAACVKEAKEEAAEDGDIPSINAAITIKKERQGKPKIRKHKCHGIFSNTVLSNNLKFDETWNATSLFANIGLGTYMLKDLNIEISVANELKADDRAPIHQELYPTCNVIAGSITDDVIYDKIVEAHKARKCRIVLMSPCCQSFSKAGNQDVNREESKLIMTGMKFLDAVNDYNDVFMCENVEEFLDACPDEIKNKGYDNICDYIEQEADRLGYIINIDYLDAACYNTGEKRSRSVVIGIKKELVQKILGTTEITADNVWKFPKPDEFKMSEEICLLGIPSIEAGEYRMDVNRLHFTPKLIPEVVEALKKTEAGGKAVVKYRDDKNKRKKVTIVRAHGDRPAPTITGETAHFGAPALRFPAGRCRTDGIQSDARYRTPYEILVLMGMPRNFELPEKIKIRDGKGNLWCKSGPVPDVPTAIQPGDIVVTDDEFRTMLGEHYCPTVVNRCFKQLIYQIQNKDF